MTAVNKKSLPVTYCIPAIFSTALPNLFTIACSLFYTIAEVHSNGVYAKHAAIIAGSLCYKNTNDCPILFLFSVIFSIMCHKSRS